jgi:hypothetical protein
MQLGRPDKSVEAVTGSILHNEYACGNKKNLENMWKFNTECIKMPSVCNKK